MKGKVELEIFLNYRQLIAHFSFSNVHVWQAFNALFLIRCLVKYLIETGTEFQLLQHFEAIPAEVVVGEECVSAIYSYFFTLFNNYHPLAGRKERNINRFRWCNIQTNWTENCGRLQI
jgi:hypothetical protein